MHEIISSISNAKIKEVRSLKDKKTRIAKQQFIVEGVNIVKDIPNHVKFDLYYVLERREFVKDIISRASNSYEVTTKVMEAMSETVNPSGVLAVADMNKKPFSASNVVLYLDKINDPGNMGTIIRTAVALGVEEIIASDSVDAYSGKVVRSSMGGIFNTNVINVSEDEALRLIDGYKVYTLDMNGDNIFDRSFSIDNSRFVLAVGSEAHGIGEKLRLRADRVLSLPMTGKIESLNAGVSMSTALYRIMFL